MAQLTCKNLTLGYDNRAIQEDLNFSIDAGELPLHRRRKRFR